ncbi:hypothetical protein [Pelagerythrobacter rhizovicinus]|uniref:Uncharacterized protein n=1 Tax=Pelagerythrobacter rhizovicinus TaxID=2268576 RepID=A0A4Q2KSA7_9SPHN|nr:hypothetical protein [Pelagerythrobacter rhizovicinus]RXZ66592.1 hypothetical protein ETX26_07955 [Pelagerythrobacter rhizovicinus]
MKAQFSEKTYENYFQIELGRRTRYSFAPGQTDEAYVGFDGAFHLPMRVLTGIIGPGWPRLAGLPLGLIHDIGAKLDGRLPGFRLNLIIQYKRPHYMSRSNASEWSSWNGAYFRYETEPRQQSVLEKVAAATAGRAAVVYASAAFWENSELFARAPARTIVAASNIAEVTRLTGHHRYSYQDAGHSGVGHSAPEPIDSEPFDAILRRGEDLGPLPFTRAEKDMPSSSPNATAASAGIAEALAPTTARSNVPSLNGGRSQASRTSWSRPTRSRRRSLPMPRTSTRRTASGAFRQMPIPVRSQRSSARLPVSWQR